MISAEFILKKLIKLIDFTKKLLYILLIDAGPSAECANASRTAA